MQTSSAARVADFPKKERPEHLQNLPEETHIVTGTLEAHGASSLASVDAKLSAKVVKLERTKSGGIDYQLAIFVAEPVQAAPVVLSDAERAVAFFVEKGFPKQTAIDQVNKFGIARVLAAAAREKEDAEKGLDDELSDLLKDPKAKK